MLQLSPSSSDILKQVSDYIRKEDLGVGDRLPSIRQFSEQFDVGRNVVRDALLQAQNIGLVRMHPRAGTFVKSLDYSSISQSLADVLEPSMLQVDHHLFDILDLRRMLEVEAVGIAAERRRLEDLLPVRDALDAMGSWQPKDDSERNDLELVEADLQFHLQIVKITGNPLMLSILQSFLRVLQSQMLEVPRSTGQLQDSHAMHWDIYNGLVDGNAAAARDAMLQHFSSVYEVLLESIQSPAIVSSRQSQENDGSQVSVNGGESP